MLFFRSPRLRFEILMRKPGGARVVLVLILMTSLLASSRQPARVYASDSDLDPTFGSGGVVTTDFLRGGDDHARGVAVQKDQKIVAAGENSGNFAVVRYNPDGSLDASFGQGGRVVTAFGTNPSSANALVLQSDGKIIVAGFARNNQQGADFALVRYNANGGLDSSFGGGKVTTAFGASPSSAGALALQTDGKIIAAGGVTNSGTLNDFALARYNQDGSLDPSFNGDGKVITDFNGQSDGAVGVAVQPDGRIVAAGTTIFMTLKFALARYNADGSLDASFGTGGRVITPDRYSATGVALQPDGKIVVVGWSPLNFFELVLARYNVDGSLDGTFGAGGIVITDPGGDFETASAVALQSDGKIVVAGGNQFFFLMARYNPNGTLDNTFGFSGLAFNRFYDLFGSMGTAVAIQSDGRIVEAGFTGTQYLATDFGLMRYNVNGSLDTSFDGDGKVTTDFPGGNDLCNAVVIQPDGKIVVAGGNAGDFALARYNLDGSLDTSFGNHGRVLTDFFGGFDSAQAVALQSDGKIIAAGIGAPSATGSNGDFALARYNPNGSLDTTFGVNGKVTTDFAGQTEQARAVAVQPDGKIVAAGGGNFGHSFELARYNPDGSLDSSFDGDGKVTTTVGSNGGEAFGIVIQPGDLKIIAAGDADSDFGLARYNPDGSLDLSFDGDGKVVTDFGGLDRARAIALQPDGKIVAAGFTQVNFNDNSGTSDFALARYNSNGSLDTTFDGDGKVITNISSVGDDDLINGVAIQSDGKIVAAGYTRQGARPFPPFDFALARYSPDGSLDISFGNNGKVTTIIGNSGFQTDKATAVAIQPNDGKIVAVGQATNSGTGVDFALARYGGTDTTPPTIVCPLDLQALTSRPREACATLNYPPPVVSDNLPGATFVCAPPSGSCFPVGSTTVSCTATDAAGNTASCSFTITVFDVLLQSDSDHSVQLLINSFTGDYSFCCPQLPPGQSPLRSRGQVLAHGSTITLTHNAPTYRLQATIDAAAGKGSASYKPLSGNVLCPIQDRNIYDNLPLRCGNVSP
jgi:uncharacterized delta-60 repeat protein